MVEPVELGCPADEVHRSAGELARGPGGVRGAGGAGKGAAAGRGGRGCGGRLLGVVVGEHLGERGLQGGAGPDPQLAVQPLPGPVVGGQRVGRPSGLVQAAHQQGHQLLAQALRPHVLLQDRHRRRAGALPQPQPGPAEQGGGAGLLQLVHRGGARRGVGQVGQGLAAPQPQRLLQQRDGRGVVTAVGVLGGPRGQRLEPQRVHLVGRPGQQVARRPGVQLERGVGEQLAQRGDMPLHGRPRTGRRPLAPQRLAELVDGDHAPQPQRQQCQDRPPLRPGQGGEAVLLDPQLHRAEQPNPHQYPHHAAQPDPRVCPRGGAV